MTNYKDTDLREALRRRYSDTPQLSADFADRLRQRIEQQNAKPKRRRVWLYSGIAAAAASVLLLLTLHFFNNVEPENGAVIAQQTESQTVAADSSSNIKNEPMPTKVVEIPLVAKAKPVKRVRRTKKKQKVEVPDLKKDLPELLETEEAVIENQAQIRPDVPDPYVLAAIQTQNIRSRGERLHNEVALIVSNQ